MPGCEHVAIWAGLLDPADFIGHVQPSVLVEVPSLRHSLPPVRMYGPSQDLYVTARRDRLQDLRLLRSGTVRWMPTSHRGRNRSSASLSSNGIGTGLRSSSITRTSGGVPIPIRLAWW